MQISEILETFKDIAFLSQKNYGVQRRVQILEILETFKDITFLSQKNGVAASAGKTRATPFFRLNFLISALIE